MRASAFEAGVSSSSLGNEETVYIVKSKETRERGRETNVRARASERRHPFSSEQCKAACKRCKREGWASGRDCVKSS